MFKNLSNLSYRRKGFKEAFGFYVAYLVLAVVAASVLGGLYGGITGTADFETGLRIGNVIAVLFCLTVSFAILVKKSMLSNFGLVILALLSGLLAAFGGGLLGLIPAAYLSTK